MGSERRSTMALVFFNDHNCFNYQERLVGPRRALPNHSSRAEMQRLDAPLQDLIVWGGVVANCGEHTLSDLVDRHASTLRSLIYMPNRTKGGVLIRPKYHLGDRGGVQLFPNLERMAIRLTPQLGLAEYGWITPALTELTLLFDWNNLGRANVKSALLSVIATQDPASYVRKLAVKCPQLRQVHVDICQESDEMRKQTRLFSIVTPKERTPWDVVRLLYLVATKPDPVAEADPGVERCHDALRQALPVLLPLLCIGYELRGQNGVPSVPNLVIESLERAALMGLHPPWAGSCSRR